MVTSQDGGKSILKGLISAGFKHGVAPSIDVSFAPKDIVDVVNAMREAERLGEVTPEGVKLIMLSKGLPIPGVIEQATLERNESVSMEIAEAAAKRVLLLEEIRARVQIINKIVEEARGTPEEILDKITGQIVEIQADQVEREFTFEEGMSRTVDQAAYAYEMRQKGVGIYPSWPWPTVNRLCAPFKSKEMVLFSGKTGVGKTGLGSQLAMHWAYRDPNRYNVIMYLFETDPSVVFQRMLSAGVDIPTSAMDKGLWNPRDSKQFKVAYEKLVGFANSTIKAENRGELTIVWGVGESKEQISARLQRLVRQGRNQGMEPIIIMDYLQEFPKDGFEKGPSPNVFNNLVSWMKDKVAEGMDARVVCLAQEKDILGDNGMAVIKETNYAVTRSQLHISYQRDVATQTEMSSDRPDSLGNSAVPLAYEGGYSVRGRLICQKSNNGTTWRVETLHDPRRGMIVEDERRNAR